VFVARYEQSVFILCECEKVVVAGIRGVAGPRGRLFGHHGRRSKERDVFVGIVGADVPTQPWVAERPAELFEKRLGDDQLEVAGDPPGKKLSRGAARGEKRGDQDVWIENRSHSAAAATCGVLRFDRDLDRLLFAQVVTSPKAVEQIEPEVASKRVFYDLAVPLARAGSADLHGAQDFLVHGQRRSHLCHRCIIAS
jgi:hypothetical protein